MSVTEADETVQEAVSATVNYEALDALRSVLGLEFSALVRDFNQQMASGMVRLELALAQRDAARIRSVAHSLKGSALSLHCKALADCCARVERGASQLVSAEEEAGGGPEGGSGLDELRECIRASLNAIDRWAARSTVTY